MIKKDEIISSIIVVGAIVGSWIGFLNIADKKIATLSLTILTVVAVFTTVRMLFK